MAPDGWFVGGLFFFVFKITLQATNTHTHTHTLLLSILANWQKLLLQEQTKNRDRCSDQKQFGDLKWHERKFNFMQMSNDVCDPFPLKLHTAVQPTARLQAILRMANLFAYEMEYKWSSNTILQSCVMSVSSVFEQCVFVSCGLLSLHITGASTCCYSLLCLTFDLTLLFWRPADRWRRE